MDLLQRLRKVEPDKEGVRTRWYRNPDGPEAADEIERLRQQNEELRKDVSAWYSEAELMRGDLAIYSEDITRLRQLNEEWREAVLDLQGFVTRADWASLVSDKTKAAYTKAVEGE